MHFAQGARGYLTKGRDIDQFTDGLRKVLDYGFYFPPEVTTPAPPPPSQHLTDREEEVVRALALGKVNKQLADMLGVTRARSRRTCARSTESSASERASRPQAGRVSSDYSRCVGARERSDLSQNAAPDRNDDAGGTSARRRRARS